MCLKINTICIFFLMLAFNLVLNSIKYVFSLNTCNHKPQHWAVALIVVDINILVWSAYAISPSFYFLLHRKQLCHLCQGQVCLFVCVCVCVQEYSTLLVMPRIPTEWLWASCDVSLYFLCSSGVTCQYASVILQGYCNFRFLLGALFCFTPLLLQHSLKHEKKCKADRSRYITILVAVGWASWLPDPAYPQNPISMRDRTSDPYWT